MNTNYFTNPQLSKKLEQLGVVSQFNCWWHEDKDFSDPWGLYYEYESLEDDNYYAPGKDDVLAYHFSDILLPEAAKKIWGIYSESAKLHYQPFYIGSEQLLFKINSNDDWQTWLEAEVDQALKQSNHKEV